MRIQAYAIQEMMPLGEKNKARSLHACIRIVQTYDKNFDKLHGWEHWRAIRDIVPSLSEVICQLMPSFWRIAKDHASGRLERGQHPTNGGGNSSNKLSQASQNAAAERLNAQFRAWDMEALHSFVSILSQFVSLTDVAILAHQPLSALPGWVPKDSCSVSAAHWMRGILLELDEAVKEICALNVGGGSANASLKNLLANARFNMTEVLCTVHDPVQELQQIIDPFKKKQALTTSKATEKDKTTPNRAPRTKVKAEAVRKANAKESTFDEPVKAKKDRKEASISTALVPQSAQVPTDQGLDDSMDDAEDQDLHVEESGDDDFFEGGGQLDDEDGEDHEDINSDVYDNEGEGEGASDDDDGDDPHNLPTLSSGFVSHGLSLRDRGSDSEFSGGSDDEDDIDENAAETAAVGADGKKKSAGKSKKEKNRPGQRA
ncbi:hypothetical protein A4X09_0g4055 [Tilletia walkeri]|uniref:Exocyst complex component EXOC2/Sec5 N-terminal domain-containing protein n=1 Tax=Tilletia walkeri TaxID=117179 RepID=A0A8X7T485_9BASI|nr:hypothetical protein A4X09_0g4055 [Tilletia walkeri]